MKSIIDIQYGSGAFSAQKLDIHLPDEGNSFPIFIYFHGGGLKGGDKTEPKLARTLTDNGIAFVSANYRMYPEAVYPDFIEDAASAVKWVSENIKNYCSPRGIYIGGSSAGGYLSMMLCFDSSWLDKYNISQSEISGYIHDAGQPTAHFNVLKSRGVDSRRVIIDETAPLYHVGTADGYPPMLFIVSDNDMQNRYEQTMLMISTLKHFGHGEEKIHLRVMHGKHCKYVSESDQEGNSIFGIIVKEFISRI